MGYENQIGDVSVRSALKRIFRSSDIDILFTGLVREPEMFKKSILDFRELQRKRIVNKIYFSTWKGEVEEYPEIKRFLKEQGVVVIESDEPKVRGLGNIWCQMKSLEVGLQNIPDNHFVLKTRADVYINPDFLNMLFSQKDKLLKIPIELPKGNLFKHRVWIHYYEVKTPFHMGEECFFGFKDDLRYLFNYEDAYDTDYRIGGGISHIRRFIHPFIQDYPIFETFLRKYSQDNPLKAVVEKERYAKKNRRLRVFFRKFKFLREYNKKSKIKTLQRKLLEDDFINALAAYYFILYSHFYVDNNSFPEQVEFYGRYEPEVDVDNFDLGANFSSEKLGRSLAAQLYAYDMKLLENLFRGKVGDSEIAFKVREAMKKFKRGEFS